MKPPLHIVTEADAPPKTETVAERVRRLQSEAKSLASDHVWALLAHLVQAEVVAREIADGGPAYHDGAQERARQIAMELRSQRETLEQIVGRTS
jgi:hypothetical protein